MGLDGVELLMAVEEEFQIVILDSEAEHCSTVEKLVELVYSRLRHSRKEPCPSQHAFYIIRKKLMNQLGLQRSEIKSETKLEEIVPVENRRKIWSEFIQALNEEAIAKRGMTAQLVHSFWKSLVAILAVPVVAFVVSILGLPFYMALLAALIATFFCYQFIVSMKTEFPRDMSQVKDLVKLVKSLNSNIWSKEEVFIKIRTITAKVLNIEESLVTLDAHFINDLGLG